MNRLLMRLFIFLSKLTSQLNSWAQRNAIYYRIRCPKTDNEQRNAENYLNNIKTSDHIIRPSVLFDEETANKIDWKKYYPF